MLFGTADPRALDDDVVEYPRDGCAVTCESGVWRITPRSVAHDDPELPELIVPRDGPRPTVGDRSGSTLRVADTRDTGALERTVKRDHVSAPKLRPGNATRETNTPGVKLRNGTTVQLDHGSYPRENPVNPMTGRLSNPSGHQLT